MNKSNVIEEVKELELEIDQRKDRRIVTGSHLHIEQLLDSNNELVIDTVWEFIKTLITTNNSSFNPQTLNAISNELQEINLKIKCSKHESTKNTNPQKCPFDMSEIQCENNQQQSTSSQVITSTVQITDNNKGEDDVHVNEETQKINQDNCDSILNMDNITTELNIDAEIDDDSDASVDLDDIVIIQCDQYSKLSCPLNLLLCMPHPTNQTEMPLAIWHKLTSLIHLKKQREYLTGSLPSTAETSANEIQEILNLTSKQMEPLRERLAQYYYIILYPQKIFECKLDVFIATVIRTSLVYENNDYSVSQSLYFLFFYLEHMKKQGCSVESILLSFDSNKLASCLSQAVFDLYGHTGIVDLQTLERVLDAWVKQYMAYKAIEPTKQLMKKSKVWLDKHVTANLMTKEYISQYFEDVTDLFHNITYTIKMQQIDGSYRKYKNDVGCKSLQLTIFSSRIKRNGNRMYIVATHDEKIDKLRLKGLFTAKELSALYGIEQLTDLPMDLMQRRADKLLCGYIRSLCGLMRPLTKASSHIGEIIDKCQYFFSYAEYSDKQYCKQSICLSPTEISTPKLKYKEKKKKNMMKISQEDVHNSIQNSIDSNDIKCQCFPVIWVDMNVYYRDEVLAVNICDNEWIGLFTRNNEHCVDWDKIQRQAKLYNVSFECKQWKNNIKSLTIQPRKEGKVLFYNYKIKSGRIKYCDIEYKFGLSQFDICDPWHIYPGMPVYFDDGRKKQRAINIKPINKEGKISQWFPDKQYGFIRCGNAQFKFNRQDYIRNDSYIHEGMRVCFCEGRRLDNAIHNKAVNIKPIDPKYD